MKDVALAVVAWCRENPILVYGIVLFTIYALAGKL